MKSKIQQFIEAAFSKSTRSLHRNAWNAFERYCVHKGFPAFPTTSDAMIEFAIDNATLPIGRLNRPISIRTIVLYLRVIDRMHIRSGLESLFLDERLELVLRGLAREYGTPPRRVKALREHDIEKMLDACSDTPIGIRNAAIIALAYSGALRRSEICNLLTDDIERVEKEDSAAPEKMFLHIRKSKTDQESKGHSIPIIQGKTIQPIMRLNKWLQVSGIESGYLFQTMTKSGGLRGNPLHPTDIARLLKRYAKLIGLDSSNISGHSLRAGFITSAAANNARYDKIMAISRHRSLTSLSRYLRDEDDFTDHSGEGFL